MPQLAMWATRHPVEFIVRYTYDPTDPSGSSAISVVVKDQVGQPMTHARVRVSGEDLDEWVQDSLIGAWLTYLYGDLEEIQRTLTHIADRWRAGSDPEIRKG